MREDAPSLTWFLLLAGSYPELMFKDEAFANISSIATTGDYQAEERATDDDTPPHCCMLRNLASVAIWRSHVSAADVYALGGAPYGAYTWNPYTAGLIHYYAIEEGEGLFVWDYLNPGQSELRGRLFPRGFGSGTPPHWVPDNPVAPGWHPWVQLFASSPP
eukprot:gene28560-35419_t